MHRVVVPSSLAGWLLRYLAEAGRNERGGVLFGWRDEKVTRVSMAIFPPQLLSHAFACSFDVGCLEVLSAAKERLTAELMERMGTIVGWVHSHPGFGLFLSATDLDTLSSWQQLDPKAIAVVADPYLTGDMGKRIAWWHHMGRGTYATLDESPTGFLTIGQVAEVAQALNDSASLDSGWDIVSARSMLLFQATRHPEVTPDVTLGADPHQEA
jgi:proteasome lid subunit RPN8/RPN11